MTLHKPIAQEEGRLRRLRAEGWSGDAVTLRALAEKGDAIRKRYENGCNYVWATTDSYQRHTERLERELGEAAKAAGLSAYIQGDPRGAALYVRPAPLPISDRDYSSAALALYFEPQD